MNARIYKIINDINNKKYVGQTYLTIDQRFERHCNEAKWKNVKKMPIVLAIKKYGKEHFKVVLLEELKDGISQNEVDQKEVEWGTKLNTLSPNGYNLKLGGSGHGLWSEDVKKRIGNSNRNKFVSEETKKKLSESHLGKRLSESAKNKLSNYWKGKRPCKLAQQRSKISCQKTYTLLDSNKKKIQITNMAEFCRKNNLNKSRMSELVNGKISSYRGWTKI